MKRKIGKTLFLGIFLGGMIGQAFAVLDVTFNQSLATDRIQYYWSGDGSAANQSGRVINPDFNIAFDLADTQKQAKAASATPPTDHYVFGASSAFPNSGTIKTRVWDGTAQVEGNKYTGLGQYTNPFGSGSSQNFNITYAYIKTTPGKGTIYQIDEGTSLTLPSTTTTQLKVYSRQQTVSGGVVESTLCEWQVTYNGTPLSLTGQTGPILNLSSPAYAFNPNDVYRVKVRYQNLWGSWGLWSDEYAYTISGPGSQSYTYTLQTADTANNKLGLNFIAMPSAPDASGNWHAYTVNSGVYLGPITNAYTLIKAINDATGSNNYIVSSFGVWDATNQNDNSSVLLQSPYNPDDPINSAAKTVLLGTTLQQGVGYQVYLRASAMLGPISLVIKNTQTQ